MEEVLEPSIAHSSFDAQIRGSDLSTVADWW
jgi:hypothetical protein